MCVLDMRGFTGISELAPKALSLRRLLKILSLNALNGPSMRLLGSVNVA